MRQRKLGSHTPPCHRRMVITTLFSVLLAALQRRPAGGGGFLLTPSLGHHIGRIGAREMAPEGCVKAQHSYKVIQVFVFLYISRSCLLARRWGRKALGGLVLLAGDARCGVLGTLQTDCA